MAPPERLRAGRPRAASPRFARSSEGVDRRTSDDAAGKTGPAFLRAFIAVCAGLLLGACGGEVSTGPNGDGGNGVGRETFVVQVRVVEGDMEAAERLGWSAGAVPGVEVLLERETADGQIADSAMATTDAAGRAEFQDLISGTYRVSALRLLDAGEIAAVESEFPTLRAFGGGDKTGASTSSPAFELEVQGNRADGLVISEYSFTATVSGQPGFGYVFFGYLEVYNNSPETIFLDGNIVTKGFPFGEFDLASRPCEQTRQAATDPDGVWGRWFQRFPGSGAAFPLPPGETAVIAVDAIDHAEQVADVFFDLTGADFEFSGTADVNNPDVPNMVDNGLEEWFLGHGLWFSGAGEVPTLVGPVTIDGLPQARVDPANDRIYVRFPADAVHDVFAAGSEWSGTMATRAFCDEMVSDHFDRLSHLLPRGFSEPPGPRLSQQRRVVGTAPGGWSILLDTNTSAVDFVTVERTLGTLPPPQ